MIIKEGGGMKWKKGDIIRLTVMVRPDIETWKRHGEAGKVVAFFPEKEIVTVQFNDRSRSVYVSDDLLVLQSTKKILAGLRSGLLTNPMDCKIILSVYRLVFFRRYAKAIKIAMTNSVTRFYCTMSCKHYIEKYRNR
jgi:hypothetical protein